MSSDFTTCQADCVTALLRDDLSAFGLRVQDSGPRGVVRALSDEDLYHVHCYTWVSYRSEQSHVHMELDASLRSSVYALRCLDDVHVSFEFLMTLWMIPLNCHSHACTEIACKPH